MNATRPPDSSVDWPAGSTKLMRRTRTLWIGVAIFAIALPVMMLIDVPAAAWVNAHRPFPPFVVTILRVLRFPGHFGFTIVLAVIALWPFRRHWRAAAALLASGAIACSFTAMLKYCFGRVRPFRGRSAFDWQPFPGPILHAFSIENLSFPSGDATLAFATATVIAQVLPRWRIIAWTWAVLVAATRVLQGAHYPSDVTAGALVGFICGRIVCGMLRVPAYTLDQRPTRRRGIDALFKT